MSKERPVRRRKNSEETRLELLLAFAKLHETKPYSEISISSICEKAGVANSTFYYYFSSINEMVSDRFEKLVSELDKACEKKDMKEAIHLGVACAKREKVIFLLMADYSQQTREQIYTRCVYPFVKKYVGTEGTSSVFQECVTVSLISATVGLLYHWLKEEKPYTEAEIENVIVEMVELADSQCEVRRTVRHLI